MRPGLALAAAGLAMTLASCAAPDPAGDFVLENATDIPVQVVVDGGWVGTYAAGSDRSVPVPGSPPHRVEVLTVDGDRLVAWGYDAAQATGGAVTTVELPCGAIRLSVGRVELPALAPRVGEPGRCP